MPPPIPTTPTHIHTPRANPQVGRGRAPAGTDDTHTHSYPPANPQVGRGRAPAGADDTHTHSYPPAPTPK
ncbi:hypothetical protein, partial [Duncaniella freteri]|uniref:hypothetical protein n=1 Tax=Duncaniella freteri TaxID=2530391 RepID=UPI003F664C3C